MIDIIYKLDKDKKREIHLKFNWKLICGKAEY